MRRQKRQSNRRFLLLLLLLFFFFVVVLCFFTKVDPVSDVVEPRQASSNHKQTTQEI
ncbi:hypothetical protein VDGD_20340 [Verticillium dahliae]|nr:hypothetical protein VDGD_20340 [Verticillium dahliae]